MTCVDELTSARKRLLAEIEADSRQECGCHDCDGRWCVHCLEHHGAKRCPFVREVEKEMIA